MSMFYRFFHWKKRFLRLGQAILSHPQPSSAGFIIECTEAEGIDGPQFTYTAFFPVDADTIHLTAPFNDKSMCFRKPNLPNTKASGPEMERARAALRESVG